MRRVIIESPFAGKTQKEIDRNTDYARACMLHSLGLGEAPFLSHLLYTRVLDDNVEKERKLGILAGFAWAQVAHATVVYVNLGITIGMMRGAEAASMAGRTVEFRYLALDWEKTV